MKYYKLTKDGAIIGVVSSDNFICYVEGCGYMNTNEQYGEYADFNQVHYRTSWMKPPHDLSIPYVDVTFLEIGKTEYDAFKAAIASNEEVAALDDEIEEEITQEQPVDEIALSSLEYIREAKISEMSLACRRIIEAGFDLELRNEVHHFSLDTQDQLNLISLSSMAQTQELIPYHADGEVCIFYTAAEINAIVAAATAHKVYHTTYYNALKTYINVLDTIEAISAIIYGVAIPQEYKSEVLIALENEASS